MTRITRPIEFNLGWNSLKDFFQTKAEIAEDNHTKNDLKVQRISP
jgi:hypothetical protein